MKKEKIKKLLTYLKVFFIKIFKVDDNLLQDKKISEKLPVKENIVKEYNKDKLPIFKVGVPNLAKDENTIKVRKFINYEFGLNFDEDQLQCVEYVQYKVKQKLDIIIQWPVRSGRHGKNWPDIFEKDGQRRYKVIDSPRKFCAISFKERHGSYGHVAFVEKVLDNESIKISEVNYPSGTKGEYNERPLPKSEWQDRYKGRFIDFL